MENISEKAYGFGNMFDKIFKSKVIFISFIFILLNQIINKLSYILPNFNINILAGPFWLEIQIILALIIFILFISSFIFTIKGSENGAIIFGMTIVLSFVLGIIETIFRFIFNDINYIDILMLLGASIFLIFMYKDHFYRGMFDREFRKAIKLDRGGKKDEALEIYNKLSKEDKKYPKLYYNISIIFFNKEKFEKALNQLDIAIKLKPNYKRAKFFKGNILSYNNNYEESLKYYNELLDDFNFNEEALKEKIESLIHIDREQEALDLIANSLKSNKNDIELARLRIHALFNSSRI